MGKLNSKLCYVLNNGVQIPIIGLGTCHIYDGEHAQAVKAIKTAIKSGYRLIDTAQFYDNETAVGQAVKESGVLRNQLFIVSKLWNTHQGYSNALSGFENSLKALGMNYIDLFLIHWPIPEGHARDHLELNVETWKALEKLYDEGKIRAIGVSNFMIEDLENLKQHCKIIPTVNQVEFHPGDHFYDQLQLYCKKYNILIMAYAPIARNKLNAHPILQIIAHKYHKSVAQICIRWAIQKGTIPIPKSSNEQRQIENLDVFDFTITLEDMEEIDNKVIMPNFFGDPRKELIKTK